MSAHILQAVALAASVLILFRVESVVNLMGRRCPLLVRAAFWLLAVGSAWLSLSITQGYRPSLGVAAVLWGVVLLLFTERRMRGLLRAPEQVLRDRRARP